MPTILLPVEDTDLTWADLREGIAGMIRAAIPAARVHSIWAMKYDIGETVQFLTSLEERVHCWMIRISDVRPTEEKVGGHEIWYNLTITLWGFIGYQYGVGNQNSQSELEREIRRITNTIKLNRKNIIDNQGDLLKDVTLPVFDDIDVHGMGDKNDVVVAQGRFTVKWRDFITTS